MVFHSLAKNTIAHKSSLSISKMSVKSDNPVKYLGRLIFDSNLNWKPYTLKFQEVLEYYLKLYIMLTGIHYINSGAIIGYGDRKRAPFLVLGLAP